MLLITSTKLYRRVINSSNNNNNNKFNLYKSFYTTTSSSSPQPIINNNNKKNYINNNITMNEEDVQELIGNYKNIKDRVEYVSNKFDKKNVTLVAVSKTKPIEMIKILYEKGHRHFGENYIQELIQKSEELSMNKEFDQIKWHYIGSIQSNKIKHLASVKNLYVVETVEKKEVLDKFAKNWDLEKTNNNKLNVMIQVNTSQEESKSGCHPNDCLELVKYCLQDDKCKEKLNFLGLMTIGSPNASDDQPDFKCLIECRNNISKTLNVPLDSIQLSMGMSHDFEPAIEFGSTSVRVGSAIFGERDYSKKN